MPAGVEVDGSRLLTVAAAEAHPWNVPRRDGKPGGESLWNTLRALRILRARDGA
jgi:hypothetical protein